MGPLKDFFSKHKLLLAIWFIILVFVGLSARYVINNDLYFHTDLARDFLVLDEIVKTKRPTLIGPRSGGIQGVFHGPLWFYLNLPAFVIGQGNPVIVAWWWVILNFIYILVIFLVTFKLSRHKLTAGFAALLTAIIGIQYTHNLFNPFGAVALFPIFVYLLAKYHKSSEGLNLALALFILGLIFQFQMAFAGPIIILTLTYSLYFSLYKKRHKLSHLGLFLVLIIPLFTFIAFDLRHDFLQLRSVIFYLTNGSGQTGWFGWPFIKERVKDALLYGWNLLPYPTWLTSITSLVFIAYLILNKTKSKFDVFFKFFFYFYFGYWLMTLAYKGGIMQYYYWPFQSAAIIVFSLILWQTNFLKKLRWLMIAVLVIGYAGFIQQQNQEFNRFAGKDTSSWRFLHQLARRAYTKAPNKFGYFVYTPDLYGYSPLYAMTYTQKEYPDKIAASYTKLPTTVLVVAPPPKEKPYLNGIYWRRGQLKITTEPDKIQTYDNGYLVEFYSLTDNQIKQPVDQFLIKGIFFR
ncbi:MAG: DUF3413 domain-containing protein [bacterium]|nr:DUF3413 domain-containing protein [bacterium]